MGKKKQNQIKVSFCGENATSVTGSMILIETNTKKILLECGLFQSNNMLKDYQTNNRKLQFKPREIDYIFLNHVHADHSCLMPRLYSEGCKAKIIAPKDSSKLLDILLRDCAYIMERDAEELSKKSDFEYHPIYTGTDVENCLQYVEEYKFGETYVVDDEISFKFVPSGHILRAAQILLYVKQGNTTKKILYTSDLGNISVDKYYTEKFEPISDAHLVIGECTYSANDRATYPKDRIKDLEKIKSVILETCYDKGGKVLIPVFSLDRCQNIVTHLYKLFGEDPNFNIPVVIDSPMAVNITRLYGELLDGEDKALYEKVMNWKNLKLVTSPEDSKEMVASKDPMVIASSSGMMVSGRSQYYSQSIIPDYKSTILFIGFASEGTLAHRIKNGYKNNNRTVTIKGRAYKNNCGIVDLRSFTSHMQKEDLLNYYSSIQCEKICLVHSSFKPKLEFGKELQEFIEKRNKSSKVVCVNKSTVLYL